MNKELVEIAKKSGMSLEQYLYLKEDGVPDWEEIRAIFAGENPNAAMESSLSGKRGTALVAIKMLGAVRQKDKDVA